MPSLQIYCFGFLQDLYCSPHYNAVFRWIVHKNRRSYVTYLYLCMVVLLKFHTKQIEIGLFNDVTLTQGDYQGQGHILY